MLSHHLENDRLILLQLLSNYHMSKKDRRCASINTLCFLFCVLVFIQNLKNAQHDRHKNQSIFLYQRNTCGLWNLLNCL